jgi:hypothetical protein
MEVELYGMQRMKVGKIFVFAERPRTKKMTRRETLLMVNGIAMTALTQRLNAEIARNLGVRVAIGLGENGVVKNAVKLQTYARNADYVISR